MQSKCKATKQDGSPCSGHPVNGGMYCWFHDPAEASRRAEGRKLGGSARSNRSRARKQILDGALSPAEVGAKLGQALTDVLARKIEPNIANAAANLGRAIVSVHEVTELEQRLAAVEEALASKAEIGGFRRGA